MANFSFVDSWVAELLDRTIQPEHVSMKKTFLFIFSLSILVSFIDGELVMLTN